MQTGTTKPCKPDHNGECLICDCWFSDCAWDRLQNKDFRYETEQELLALFRNFLRENHERVPKDSGIGENSSS